MNKNIAALSLALISLPAIAENKVEANYPASDAKSITYRVTLYREDNYDQEVWNKLVHEASTAIKRADALQADASAATSAIVDAFVNGIQEVYKQNSEPIKGVHGQMSIEVADSFDDSELE